jgi:hypothetical protein
MQTQKNTSSSLVSTSLTIVGLLAWHLGHIAMLRPDYSRISDTKPVLASFFGLYALATSLRWCAIGATNWKSALLAFVVNVVVIFVVFAKKDKSLAVISACFGGSALVGFISAFALTIGLVKPGNSMILFTIAETIVFVQCIRVFREQSQEIQAKGYKPKPSQA